MTFVNNSEPPKTAASTSKIACFLGLNWPISVKGGVNEVVKNLYHYLISDSDLRPVIFYLRWDGSVNTGTDEGFEFVACRSRAPFIDNGRFALGYFRTLIVDLIRLWRLLRQERVQVINLHFPGFNAVNFFLLRRLGLFRGKVCLSIHGSDVKEIVLSSGIQIRMWRWLLEAADVVTVCSNDLNEEVLRIAPRAEVRVIRNGADISIFQAIGHKSTHPRTILNIAYFNHVKGHDVLLHSLVRVRGVFQDIRLVLVGGAGPTLEGTKELIRNLGLADAVDIHLDVSHAQIPHYMEQADCFVLASRSEGFPVVLIEAGAAGLPIIATKVGGIPEVLQHGWNALLVQPEESEELADAIIWALSSPNETALMAERWRKDVLRNYSKEKMCSEYLDALVTS